MQFLFSFHINILLVFTFFVSNSIQFPVCLFPFILIMPFSVIFTPFSNLVCLCSSVSQALFSLSLYLLCCSLISCVTIDEIICSSVANEAVCNV